MGQVAGDVRFARAARANHNAALAEGYPAQDLGDGGGAVVGGEGGPFSIRLADCHEYVSQVDYLYASIYH